MPKRKKLEVPVMKIVQIKGSNGTGKTTIVKQLGELSENWTYLQWPDGMVYATVFDDINWVAIGKYDPDARMGGCDCMPNIDSIKRAIKDVLRECPGFWIVFEGMMISTIKSTFYDFLLSIAEKNRHIEPIFLILKSDPMKCVERIEGRGSKKPNLNIDNVAGKCELVKKHGKEYDSKYVRWMNVDDTPKCAMVDIFLWEVYDAVLMDAIYGNDFGGYDKMFPGCADE